MVPFFTCHTDTRGIQLELETGLCNIYQVMLTEKTPNVFDNRESFHVVTFNRFNLFGQKIQVMERADSENIQKS